MKTLYTFNGMLEFIDIKELRHYIKTFHIPSQHGIAPDSIEYAQGSQWELQGTHSAMEFPTNSPVHMRRTALLVGFTDSYATFIANQFAINWIKQARISDDSPMSVLYDELLLLAEKAIHPILAVEISNDNYALVDPKLLQLTLCVEESFDTKAALICFKDIKFPVVYIPKHSFEKQLKYVRG